MQAVLDVIKKDAGSIRTGRAAPSLIEEIQVSVYGGTQKLKIVELATISAPDPQTLVLEPFDKSITDEIRNGILAANLGFNPSLDGEIIRISLPLLTGEDREKYVKLLSQKIENGRIAIRQIRGEAIRDIKHKFENRQISEDEKFRAEKNCQETTDKFIREIDEISKKKEQEIRQV